MSAPRTTPIASPAGPVFFAAALALAALIPLLGLPVYFRTDDVHWLGWAMDHANPLAAFDPGQNLFGYYRPVPTLAWWIMARLFGFEPLGYQLVLAAVAVGAMVPLYRIGRRLTGTEWGGLAAVGLFHALNLTLLYYVFWYSALTFGLELLLLLLAFDALLDGTKRPGRPVAFVIFGLLAGLAKQPALLILPIVAGGILLSEGMSRRRWLWAAAIATVALALLLVTPFVAHRPEALSAMPGADRADFLRERLGFYLRVLLRGPAGPLTAFAALLALAGPAIPRGRAARVLCLLAGALLAGSLRFLPPTPGGVLWLLLLLGAALRVPASRPWLAGFLVPAVLLLGVDFHVATYLLEPLLCLVPATLLWLGPHLDSPGRWLTRRLDRLPRAAAVLPLIGLALAGVGLRDQVPPIVAMRQVRAVFRAGVERLLSEAPPGTTVGCLTYDEIGSTYADIRRRPLGERVEMHKTMNPAQLEKFLRLRGRGDLRVVSLAQARTAEGVVYLLALNAEEAEILGRLPGSEPVANFTAGRAVVELYRYTGQ